MNAVTFALALALAAALAPFLLRALVEGGHVRPNYRGRRLAFPFGILIVLVAMPVLGLLALLARAKVVGTLHPETARIAIYVFGIAFLGLLDDALGDTLAGGPRGWRGHGRAALQGRISTGALKAVGSTGLALYALSGLRFSTGHWLLASAVVVLATNALNLLDLRPGRATKAFLLLGTGLTIIAGSARALWLLGAFVAPALIAGIYDLRERAMLGDTGANLLGALAGLWLVLTLSSAGLSVALVLLVALTVCGELRSLASLVERLPLVRHLDSLGRPS